ncbi:MAG: hypothetical protein M9915_12695 [Rhizobacter sp.]|nr:hypothetical protein [Rhizobacter sp.]
MYAFTPVKTVMLIAIASVFATGIELAGIDTLAAPRAAEARRTVVQLPTVVVTAQREALANVEVRQLPRVVITANRATTTAAAQAARSVTEI